MHTKRFFIVGSEWLYYNIYVGPQSSDLILIDVIKPLAEKLISKQIIDKWFFIRYKDENGIHLRLRFHLCNIKNVDLIINGFYKSITPFIKNKLVSNVSINTYKRELERYGKNTIQDFETLFFINSKLILDILNLTEETNTKKWLYGLVAIDSFLNSWNIDDNSKKELFENLKISFANEFKADKNSRKYLSNKFRENKNEIENLFESSNIKFERLLKKFEAENKFVINLIDNKLRKDKNNSRDYLWNLLASYIHMHCNRLFNSKQRKNEWVLYDLLFQYYNSKIARMKYDTAKTNN